MFANDTDLFFSHSDINVLFEEMNKELKNLSHWFNANKLLLNVKKTKYSFFSQIIKKRCYSAAAPNLNTNWFTVASKSSIKL